MKKFILFFLFTLPIFAGWSAKAPLTFSGATGSTTLSNFTATFSGTDTMLKSAANGGLIQNTVTRLGQTVPVDFALTSDSSGNTVTGYNWSVIYWNPSTGTILGTVMLSSYAPATSVNPTVIVGNPAVTTWQGNAQGLADCDTYTKGYYHLENGTTLNVQDACGNFDGTTTGGPSAITGKIGGAVSLSGSNLIHLPNLGFTSSAGPRTYSAWVQRTTNSFEIAVASGTDNTHFAFGMGFNAYNVGDVDCTMYAAEFTTTAGAVPTGGLHHVACVFDGGTANASSVHIYVDGVAKSVTASSGDFTPTINDGSYQIGALPNGSDTAGGQLRFTGTIDEVKFAKTNRSADWILNDYTTQNSPSVIGTFTLIKHGGARLIYIQ
jgi:hypothetical protein